MARAHTLRVLGTVLTVATLCLTGVAAEQLPVRTVTTADGLPRDQLACVVSDPRGFIWFCSAEGLVRFDGRTAVTFGREQGLTPAAVRSFLRTRDGRYWIGTDGGLVQFRTDATGVARFRHVTRQDGRAEGGVNGLAESRDGTLWCATGRGLLHLDTRDPAQSLREVEIDLPRSSESDQVVRAVLEDERGMLWVGAGSGLYLRRPDGTIARFTTSNGLPVNEVWALAVDSSGRLWGATRQGLAWIDRAAVERPDAGIVRHVFTALDGLPATNVKALAVDRDTLWVGTVVGVAEAHVTRAERLEVRRSLTGFYAWSVMIDARGDVWTATEAGARKLSPDGFTTYSDADGLPARRVSSVFAARDGTVCATTLAAHLEVSCFDGRRFRAVPLRATRAIADPGWGWSQLTLQARDGRWWVPTGRGLLELPAGPPAALATARVRTLYDVSRGLPSGSIFRLFEDSHGRLWVATFDDARNGLARIDPQTRSVETFGVTDGLPELLPIVHALAEDREGHLWIGLEDGLLMRYRHSRFEQVSIHPGVQGRLSSEHIRAILVDHGGRLWIASTLSGVGYVANPDADSPTVKWYDTSSGLSSNTAWALAEDGHGDLLVATGRGVDRLNVASGSVVHYTPEDGVPRGEVWGALRDRTGHVWFATTDGAARLDERDPRAPEPRPTVITALRVGGVPSPVNADGASLLRGIVVNPGERRIEIDFVSPGMREADGLRYQHRLEGVDRQWTTTSAGTVAFAGAAPGRYRFVVRAVLPGNKVGSPAAVEFTVLAPVWRQWWFIASAAAAVVAAAAGAHRLRMRQLLELERVRARIAADLHDSVGASLSRIAIMSEVVRRQAGPVLPDAVPALTSIAENARAVIDDMSDAVWFIDPHVDTLQHLVVRIRAVAAELFDERGIAWTLDEPPFVDRISLTPDQRRHLYLILKEGLTNVVRHAHATRVHIRLETGRGRLCAEIDDDGCGQPDAPPRPQRGGRGIASMQRRAASIGGGIAIGPGAGGRGTCVRLDMPLGRSRA